MVLKVEILDTPGNDWTIRYSEMIQWIENTWPGISRGSLGRCIDCYNTIFRTSSIEFYFEDAQKAMMFKLAWG